MARYSTPWFCTDSESALAYHLKLHPEEAPRLVVTPDAHLIFSHLVGLGGLRFWSDGAVTARFFSRREGPLPLGDGAPEPTEPAKSPVCKEVLDLLVSASDSDTGMPGREIMGKLRNVESVEYSQAFTVGPPRGAYARETIEHHRCRMRDGTSADLYVLTNGYFEGYEFEMGFDPHRLLGA